MDTETVTVLPKGEDFEIIVRHDQSGSAYGITLSKNACEQLRQHFVVGRNEQLVCPDCKHKARMQNGFIWCENDDCGGIYRAN